jgi:excisionase family DNA binding protein
MNYTFEQLPQAVNELHDKLTKIEQLLTEQKHGSENAIDELLTVQQAAELLSLSVPTIYGLISKGEIPVMKRSKRCYFSKTEILEYLKEGRKSTISEVKAKAGKQRKTGKR